MPLKDNKMNYNIILTNKRIILIVIVLSLSVLTVLTAAGGVGLASDNIASAQSNPSKQGMASAPDMHTDTLVNRRRRYTSTNRRPVLC